MKQVLEVTDVAPDQALNVRARTTVTMDHPVTTLVHMRNRDDWPREQFLAWLDDERDRAGYKHDLELAEAADISHSSISGWRNGRQRPSAATLKKIAKALGRTPHDVWLRAGVVDTDDVGPAVVREDHEPTAEERRAIALIKNSKLSKQMQDMLIRQYLEERRQAETKLKQTIDMLEDAHGK